MKIKNLRGHLSTITFGLLIILATGFLFSCEDKNTEENLTDQQLYEMAIETIGFQWYNNSDDTGLATEGSEHNLPYFRTRFNEKGATKLNENGRVIEGSVFPEGTFIVKELYDSNDVLAIYAVRYKMTGHSDADENGWCWGYMNADGTVREPASNKGMMCIECHQKEGSIDYVLLNKVFE